MSKPLSFNNEFRNAKASLSSENFLQNLIAVQQQADLKQGGESTGLRSTGLSATFQDSRFKEVEFLLRSDVQMKIKEASSSGDQNEEQVLSNQKLMLDKMFRR